jgi:hypothetical protein
MKVRLSALIAAVVAALLVASGAPAGDEQGTRYYLSLGDSRAAGSERGGDVTRNGKTVTFKGGECDVYPRYVVVNIGTVSPTGSKPYFGLLVGKHPAATTADPVVAKDGVYRKGLVTAKAPGFSAGLYDNPDLEIVLSHGRRAGTFSGSKRGSKLFGTPAEKISGTFTC